MQAFTQLLRQSLSTQRKATHLGGHDDKPPGGIASPGGAVAGGFIVGVLENLVAYFGNLLEKSSGIYIIGNGEKLSVALIIVITVLTLKPSGLFGRVTVKRV